MGWAEAATASDFSLISFFQFIRLTQLASKKRFRVKTLSLHSPLSFSTLTGVRTMERHLSSHFFFCSLASNELFPAQRPRTSNFSLQDNLLFRFFLLFSFFFASDFRFRRKYHKSCRIIAWLLSSASFWSNFPCYLPFFCTILHRKTRDHGKIGCFSKSYF